MESKEARSVTYELEIPIDADPESVWKAFTAEVNQWWLPDFHMAGPGSVVTLEPEAGGHLLETHEDGSSLLWATVIMCTPGKSLHMAGHVAPEWGGPNTNVMHVSLTEHEGGTLLSVQNSIFGHVDDSHVQSMEEGWRQLFTEGLKRHAESR